MKVEICNPNIVLAWNSAIKKNKLVEKMNYAHSIKMKPVFLNETLTALHVKATNETLITIVFINTDKVLRKLILYMPVNSI